MVGEREIRWERRLPELDWAGGSCVGECDWGTGAAVPSESSRLLFAEVFGLVRWTCDGTGDGTGAGAAGPDDGPTGSEDSGSGTGSSSGADVMPGMENKLPKSAFCTW